jgi:hypothetical protein
MSGYQKDHIVKMEDNKVVCLNEYEPVAECPECGSQSWYVHLDSFSTEYIGINKLECTDCHLEVEFDELTLMQFE